MSPYVKGTRPWPKDDGAATTKCLDPNCPCQETDKPEPNLINSKNKQAPSETQIKWRDGTVE